MSPRSLSDSVAVGDVALLAGAHVGVLGADGLAAEDVAVRAALGRVLVVSTAAAPIVVEAAPGV